MGGGLAAWSSCSPRWRRVLGVSAEAGTFRHSSPAPGKVRPGKARIPGQPLTLDTSQQDSGLGLRDPPKRRGTHRSALPRTLSTLHPTRTGWGSEFQQLG